MSETEVRVPFYLSCFFDKSGDVKVSNDWYNDSDDLWTMFLHGGEFAQIHKNHDVGDGDCRRYNWVISFLEHGGWVSTLDEAKLVVEQIIRAIEKARCEYNEKILKLEERIKFLEKELSYQKPLESASDSWHDGQVRPGFAREEW